MRVKSSIHKSINIFRQNKIRREKCCHYNNSSKYGEVFFFVENEINYVLYILHCYILDYVYVCFLFFPMGKHYYRLPEKKDA